MERAFLLATAASLVAVGCVSPVAPDPVPTPRVFEAWLTAEEPAFSVTLGPAPAGGWRADLAYENLRQVIDPVRLTVRGAGGELVAAGEVRTPNVLTARWPGGAQATYRIEVVGVDVDPRLGEIITLQVLAPPS